VGGGNIHQARRTPKGANVFHETQGKSFGLAAFTPDYGVRVMNIEGGGYFNGWEAGENAAQAATRLARTRPSKNTAMCL
jgi:hypothetical protein